MDWRRTLPLLVLLLNGWIAIGFMPDTFIGPVSLVLFASLTGVGILSGLTVKGEPRETEQNVLAVGLIVVLVAAIGLTILARLQPERFGQGGIVWILIPLWAILSGYTAGRFWSVPRSTGPEGRMQAPETKKKGPEPASSVTRTTGPGLENERGPT